MKEDDKHILKSRINHPPLIPLSEYSLFSERAIQARLIGFFKEKQKRALGALKNVMKYKIDQVATPPFINPYKSDFTGDLVLGADKYIGNCCGLLVLKISDSYHIASSNIEIWNAIVS